MSRLDLINVENVNGTTEDKVLCLLFLEKSLTKNEIKKELNISYGKIFDVIVRMENKGLVVCRSYGNGDFYYLTQEGCYQAEYRINKSTFLDIYEYLIDLGYNVLNVIGFLKNRFYRYYLEGVWEGNTIEQQYLNWCEENKLYPSKPGRTLKKTN